MMLQTFNQNANHMESHHLPQVHQTGEYPMSGLCVITWIPNVAWHSFGFHVCKNSLANGKRMVSPGRHVPSLKRYVDIEIHNRSLLELNGRNTWNIIPNIFQNQPRLLVIAILVCRRLRAFCCVLLEKVNEVIIFQMKNIEFTIYIYLCYFLETHNVLIYHLWQYHVTWWRNHLTVCWCILHIIITTICKVLTTLVSARGLDKM